MEPNGVEEDRDTALGLADVARELQEQHTPRETWQRIIELAVDQIVGCQAAGISLLRGNGAIDTPVASDDIVRKIDEIQFDTQQGPCVDAIREHGVYQAGNLLEESRWPDFARRAAEDTGVRSMMSFRLFVEGDTLGALNLYSGHVDAFSDHDRSFGTLFATHAALAMSHAIQVQHVADLELALQSNRTIGMAIGLLMQQRRLDEGAAFQALSEESQRSNVKLRTVASQVVSRHLASLH